MQSYDDIPGTRHAIERVATKFNVYFFFVMAMLGSALFIAGLIQLLVTAPSSLNSVSEATLLTAIGLIVFALFFPLFTAIYFARHLLLSVKRLEQDNAQLRAQVSALSNGCT